MHTQNLLATQQPRLELVTNSPGTEFHCVVGSGQENPGIHYAALQPQFGKPSAGRQAAKGVGHPDGKEVKSQRATVPAACPRALLQGSGWQPPSAAPRKAALSFLCLVTDGCLVVTGR